MSNPRNLDIIIKKVNKSTQPGAAQNIVSIDTGTGKAISGNKFPFFNKNLKYYLVSNSNDSRHTAECKCSICTVRDFKSDHSIDICIKYQAICEAGNETKLTETLFDGTHPEAVLDGMIQKWILQYSRDNDNFLYLFYEKQKDLES